MMLYNPNLDLVNDNVYTKFGHILSIRENANLPKFELIQAFMHVLDTCKNEEDPIKNEGARLFTRFLPL